MIYHNLNPYLFDLGFFQIRWYGLFFALGFLFTFLFFDFLAKKKIISLKREQVPAYFIYLLFGIIFGARLFYVIFYYPSYYFSHPLEIIFFRAGLSFHGGLVGALLSTWLFAKKQGFSFLSLADFLVFPASLFLALGRLGNLFNAELIGRPSSLWFCLDYSKNAFLSQQGEVLQGCYHPSQVYEFLKNLFIFSSLFLMKKYNKFRFGSGLYFSFFLFFYGLLRFLVEFFRQPDPQLGLLAGLSMGQWLSLPLIIVGFYLLHKLKK